MIKKAVIAAAGKGTRMLHLTEEVPKPLIKINERPFLYYVLKNFQKAGLKEFIIVTGHKKEKIKEFAENHKKEFNITLIDQSEKCGPEKYGTSVSVECTRDAVGNEQFIYVYGDHLHDPEDIKKFQKGDNYTYMGVLEVKNPEKYGVAVTDSDNFLKKIVEKPKEYIGNLINIGIFKFTPEIFDEIEKVTASERGEYELTDAIQALAEHHKVKVIEVTGGWHKFSNPEDVKKLSNFLKTSN